MPKRYYKLSIPKYSKYKYKGGALSKPSAETCKVHYKDPTACIKSGCKFKYKIRTFCDVEDESDIKKTSKKYKQLRNRSKRSKSKSSKASKRPKSRRSKLSKYKKMSYRKYR